MTDLKLFTCLQAARFDKSIRMLSLVAGVRLHEGVANAASGEPERTLSGQRLTRTGSRWQTPNCSCEAATIPAHTPGLPVFAPPYKNFRGNRTAAEVWSHVMPAAASSSATASVYVIRPDRDMRQFDGSIV